MIIREDAIYGRQSVDRKDSISIESQIEFCKYELRGGNFRKYTDKGYSGKNTDRPKFQEMMADIRRGLIKRVVVYKLDRISRSILDFATMMETFQEYNVEFVSSTEKFDTSTPMGRAMLNICIVFAQLERETIQKRVTDAYYSRCQHGFHMSGAAPYGFQLEPTTIEGIRTKMMKPDPETADIAKLMFEMYSQPATSFGDIARYFADEGIRLGMNWLYTAAVNGSHYAMYRLAKELFKGDLIKRNSDAAVEWFTRSAERGNPYAQYMLGKLYLAGKEVPRDEEQAVHWLSQSAKQDNQYAHYLLNHLEENRPPSAMLAVTRLLHHMSRVFRDNSVPKSRPGGIQIDRKRLKKLQEKRIALGHKQDDHEQQWPDLTM